jgi:hypothetical protein
MLYSDIDVNVCSQAFQWFEEVNILYKHSYYNTPQPLYGMRFTFPSLQDLIVNGLARMEII